MLVLQSAHCNALEIICFMQVKQVLFEQRLSVYLCVCVCVPAENLARTIADEKLMKLGSNTYVVW